MGLGNFESISIDMIKKKRKMAHIIYVISVIDQQVLLDAHTINFNLIKFDSIEHCSSLMFPPFLWNNFNNCSLITPNTFLPSINMGLY